MGTNTNGGAKYEVGKFYWVSVSCGFGISVKVPALCVRKLKRKIVFRHIEKNVDGRLSATEVTRWWWLGSDNNEYCHTGDTWHQHTSRADEPANEPKRWQEVC